MKFARNQVKIQSMPIGGDFDEAVSWGDIDFYVQVWERIDGEILGEGRNGSRRTWVEQETTVAYHRRQDYVQISKQIVVYATTSQTKDCSHSRNRINTSNFGYRPYMGLQKGKIVLFSLIKMLHYEVDVMNMHRTLPVLTLSRPPVSDVRQDENHLQYYLIDRCF